MKDAICKYICKLHLYDDDEINNEFIEFLKRGYNNIILYDLESPKLNKEIIETLIYIHKQAELTVKFGIDRVLVNHYEIIKDIDCDFEKLFINKDCLIVYKKIKHFFTKSFDDLMDIYINSIKELGVSKISNNIINGKEDEEDYKKELITLAMGEALFQMENKISDIILFIRMIISTNKEDFYLFYMPYIIYLLCKYIDKTDRFLIEDALTFNTELLENNEECKYYFSYTFDKGFEFEYIKRLEDRDVPYEWYDVARYLDSNNIDDFLLSKIK